MHTQKEIDRERKRERDAEREREREREKCREADRETHRKREKCREKKREMCRGRDKEKCERKRNIEHIARAHRMHLANNTVSAHSPGSAIFLPHRFTETSPRAFHPRGFFCLSFLFKKQKVVTGSWGAGG